MFQTPRILGLQARVYRVNGMNKFYFGYQDQNEVETCLEAGVGWRAVHAGLEAAVGGADRVVRRGARESARVDAAAQRVVARRANRAPVRRVRF